MNLLLITGESIIEEKGEPIFPNHFELIKDFGKFMFNKSEHKCKKHFCMYCLQSFTTEEILTKHINNCMVINGVQAVEMPTEENNILKFENDHKEKPTPFVIYADFEAILFGCQPNNDSSYTNQYQKHTDCGFGYKVVCRYNDKYTRPVQFTKERKLFISFFKIC